MSFTGTHVAKATEKDVGKSDDDPAIVLVLGGDLGLGGSNQPISAKGGVRHGRLNAWSKMTQGIAPLLDGDIHFANLETVVTDRKRIAPSPKLFNFKMHVEGVRHLVGIGFNVFSTANNHSVDYGQVGMRETLRHLTDLKSAGLLAFPGVGQGREAAIKPSRITVKGREFAISALGIGRAGLESGAGRFGQVGYSSQNDFIDAAKTLSDATGDYRILSVHYGQELQIRPSSRAVAKLRDVAVRDNGIDLVVGHHAHVAAGVQLVDDKIIFYGLGNLLHLGMQDMAKFGPCRDFGLIARVYLAPDQNGGLKAFAIEVLALTAMHVSARQMTGAAAAKRIAVLNGLARGLDHRASGSRGARFRQQADGSGLYCLAGARRLKGRIGALCSSWPEGGHQTISDKQIAVHRCGASRIVDRNRRRLLRKTRRTRTGNRRSGFVDGFYARTYGQ